MEDKYLYRVEFEYNNYSFHPSIVVQKFKIKRETECYYFIKMNKIINNNLVKSERKIAKNARKGYARPTVLEAIKDFEARQQYRKIFLEQSLKNTKLALEALKKKNNVDGLVNNGSIYI